MFAEPLPCDREESEEVLKLRAFISEYEELMDLCHDSEAGPLSPDEQYCLDRMYATLLVMEEELWQEGLPASPLIIETLRDRMDLEFPLVYFSLGLIAEQNFKRSSK